MARHNLFLGTASGSVGDVTLMRREGVQVARTRVREIANPKTTAQAIQRNFMAPVAKFYAPLATMLEKSYEGLSKSKSYSAFLKKNIDLARKNGWYLPKGTPFFPLPYQLTRGTVAPTSYELESGASASSLVWPLSLPEGIVEDTFTVGALSNVLMTRGYQEGDQVTVLVIVDQGEGEYVPVYTRFYLAPDSTEILKDVLGNVELNSATEVGLVFRATFNSNVAAGAIIISRWDNEQWRRSSQQLAVRDDIMADVMSAAQAELSIASYQNNTTTVQSDVYLNGSTQSINIAQNDGQLLTLVGLKNGILTGAGANLAAVDENGTLHPIINQIAGSSNNGKYLASTSAWSSEAAPASVTKFVPLTSADGELAQWLMSQGVAQSVFQ